jgi:glycosyl transferase family 25
MGPESTGSRKLNIVPSNTRVLVIGLEDRYRGQPLEAALSRARIPFTRVAGVQGEFEGRALLSFADQAGAQALFGRHLTDGEIGCALAHLRAVREGLEGGAEWVLILEDDARIADLAALAKVIDYASTSSKKNPTIFSLYARAPLAAPGPTRISDTHWVSSLVATPNSTVAYLVNRGGMMLLNSRILPLVSPADWPLRIDGDIDFFCVYPFPVFLDLSVESRVGDREWEAASRTTRVTRRLWVLAHGHWFCTAKYRITYRAYFHRQILRWVLLRTVFGGLTHIVPQQAPQLQTVPLWAARLHRMFSR